MHKYRMWCLVTMITGLVGCATNDDAGTSSAEQAVAGTDTLWTGEKLFAGQAISSGTTSLVYQGDNNLVLYRNGTALWATMAGLGLTTALQSVCISNRSVGRPRPAIVAQSAVPFRYRTRLLSPW